MKDILSTIIAAKRIEVAEAKLHTPMNMLERQLDELQLPRVASLASSLAASPYGIIAAEITLKGMDKSRWRCFVNTAFLSKFGCFSIKYTHRQSFFWRH